MQADTIFRSYQQSLMLFQIQLFEPLTFLNGSSTGNQMFKNRKRIAGNVIYTNLLIYPHGPVHRGYPPWHVSYTFSRLAARIEVYSHTSRTQSSMTSLEMGYICLISVAYFATGIPTVTNPVKIGFILVGNICKRGFGCKSVSKWL